MADQKITELTLEAAPVATDIVAMVDDPGGTPVTKKATLSSLAAAVVGVVPTTYAKTLLDDADAATARATLGIVGSGDPLDTASDELDANIDIPTAGTFVDGPSISLAAGTWLVIGRIALGGSSTNQFLRGTAKLWDGTTVYSAGEQTCPAIPGATSEIGITMGAIISLGGTTTVKLSATGSTNGQDILADNLDIVSGNHASNIFAVRIG